ncbi:DUF58 domain-containing protein [bacterium]|nr:DUF58 domain-containing protein [bacterium]
MWSFLKSLYFRTRLFAILALVVIFFVLGFFFPTLTSLAKVILFTLLLAASLDAIILFRMRKGIFAMRETGDRFSNGDENTIHVTVENFYAIPVTVAIIDELPTQFQIRDQQFRLALSVGASKTITYKLTPVERGVYEFGALNIYVSSAIGLVRRRFIFDLYRKVKVYPSYLQMRKYELLAISNNLVEAGIKKVRRIGHTFEFDRIREYVRGDDYRTVNWKATARKNEFMVNEYEDEKSQQIYSAIDKGRIMKMPFEGMSLLDYAINASLVISNIAIQKQDKAGLITFSNKIDAVLPADKKSSQMLKILELLYSQTTRFLESNFELLYVTLRTKVRQRSLILLFSNFETLSSLKRQLPFLRKIAMSHLLVVIFFENTELKELIDQPATGTEEIYLQTVAEKFEFDKRQIVKELARYGIHSVLTAPGDLSASTINKYLELKARGFI